MSFNINIFNNNQLKIKWAMLSSDSKVVFSEMFSISRNNVQIAIKIRLNSVKIYDKYHVSV